MLFLNMNIVFLVLHTSAILLHKPTSTPWTLLIGVLMLLCPTIPIICETCTYDFSETMRIKDLHADPGIASCRPAVILCRAIFSEIVEHVLRSASPAYR